MISSLPKPLQNDFDTIVIDLLSRYSLDNKSVQKFVQTVAQQVRSMSNVPRTMRPAKQGISSSGQQTEQTKEETSNKPNFLTRLENLQNTFNKGGLLGVFFEYLKNRQPDAKANVVTPNTPDSSSLTSTDTKATPNLKQVDQKTEVFEKTTTQLEKLQEAFDSKGLINVVENIFNLLKSQTNTTNKAFTKNKKDISSLPSSTTNTNYIDNNTQLNQPSPYNPSFATTNYTSNKIANFETTDNKSVTSSISTTTGSQSQQQDVLPDEISVILGGINNEGENDLKRILKSVFENLLPKEKRPSSAKKEDKQTETSAQGGGLLSLLGDMALLKNGLGLLGKALGSVTSTISKAGSSLLNLARMPVKTALSGGGGAAGVLGAAGAVVGGEMIGGAIGESIISNEKFSEYWYGDKEAGKRAAEEYGTGITGFAKASWALGSQMIETKKSEAAADKQAEQLKIRETKLTEKIQQYGYKTKEEFAAARKAGQAPALKWDVTKQEYIEIAPKTAGLNEVVATVNKPQKEQLQAISEAKMPENTKQEKPWPTLNPEVKPLPSDMPVTDIEKPATQTIELAPVASPSSLKTTETPSTSPSTIKPATEQTGIIPDSTKIIEPPISLTPEITNITPPTPPSVTENHIVNNTMDKKVLGDIADNTEKTNKSINSLSDAVFSLAKVFDSKKMSNNSVLINAGQQVQEYTSASQIAANNIDTIRGVRQQFLNAINT